MKPSDKKKQAVLYATVGLCLTVGVFGVLYLIQTQPGINSKQPTSACQQHDILTICPRIAEVPNVPAMQRVAYTGSAIFLAQLNKSQVLSRFQQAHPDFQLQWINPSSGKPPDSTIGIKWLIEGTYDLSFALSSRRIKHEENTKAKEVGIKLGEESVAYYPLAVFVSTEFQTELIKHGLNHLTLRQVQDIFRGIVKNWKDVGGPNLKITLIKRNTLGSGIVNVFQDQVLNKEAFGENQKEVSTDTEAKQAIANIPGAISFTTASETIGQNTIRVIPIAKDRKLPFASPCFYDGDGICSALNKNSIINGNYPQELVGNLYVVIKQDSKLKEQAGVAFANMLFSDEGQKLLEGAGFVSLRGVP